MTTVIEFCTPPVPGERHKYYGDAHNRFIKLPHLQILPPLSSEPLLPASPVTIETIAPTAVAATTTPVSTPPPPLPTLAASPTAAITTQPSAGPTKKIEQQKTLHTIASSGNLSVFKQVLQLLPDPLKAVNDPHPSTGLTPIHFAASRGHVDIVRCLVEDYHVSVDSRDKEGETPLLKASYAGHYHVVKYLLSKKANIHQKDKDGWTALHNACSRGNLQVVRLLVEQGARVNAQNKTGHTPLINAASKGYMSIVEYLLDAANANPLIKNNFEEAAYDVSAASGEAGEAYICEMLEKAGSKWWRTRQLEGELSPSSSYELLEYHVTVMVILHENQRSSSLLGLSRPHFSANSLTRHDQRGPWSYHPSGIPTSKDKVMLPVANNRNGASNWFWLTDWQIDYSDPRVDPTSGWQYSRSFEDQDDAWTPVAPTSGYGWVRRRRWVRVMKRRMDLAKGYIRGSGGDEGGEGLGGSIVEVQRDYLDQAEDLVQNAKDAAASAAAAAPDSAANDAETLRRLTSELRVYEEAVQMLLAGIKTDMNQFRKHQGTILVKSHTAHIEKLNTQITALGSKLSTPVSPVQHNPELARELGLTNSVNMQGGNGRDGGYMPDGSMATDLDANPWSRDSGGTVEDQPAWTIVQHDDGSPTLNAVMLSHHTDENGLYSSEDVDIQEGPRSFVWEADINVKECRWCERRFGLLVRRHHCRRCGLIVCDRCSASRTYLNASEILQDPNSHTEQVQVLASQHHRVCDKCYADLGMRRA